MFLTINEEADAFQAKVREPEMRATLRTLLAQSLKSGKALAVEADVEFSTGIVDRWRPEHGRAIHFDTAHALVLVYSADGVRVPAACAGFEVRGPRPNVSLPPYRLLIRQLQGVRAGSDALTEDQKLLLTRAEGAIRWERFMVRAAVELARRMPEFNKVWVQRAEDNAYYQFAYASTDAEAQNGRLKMRYDVTAKRCGFKDVGSYFELQL